MVLGPHLHLRCRRDLQFLKDRLFLMDPLFLRDLKCPMALWVLGHHLLPQFHLVPLFRTALPFRRVQQYLGHLMFRSVLWLHWHLLFLTVPPCRMDRLRPLDLMCHLALWVLGPRWLRQSPRGQPLLRDPMFRWVLWVLGRHLHRLCRMDPRFLEYLVPPMCRLVRWLRSLPQFRMDRLFLMGQQLLLDPNFHSDLSLPKVRGHHLHLQHRWLRRSRMDRLLLRDLMCHLDQ